MCKIPYVSEEMKCNKVPPPNIGEKIGVISNIFFSPIFHQSLFPFP
jgi:hypothetical protein